MEVSQVEWCADKRVIYIKRPLTVNIEDITLTSDRIIELLDESSVPIHIINDARGISLSPKSMALIRKSAPFHDHPHLGWFITLSSNAVISFMANIIPQMGIKNNKNVKAVSNLEDALAILNKYEPNLEWDNSVIERLCNEKITS